MKKKQCEITGEEIHEMSADEAVDVMLGFVDAARKQAAILIAIHNHFKDHHSLSFIQFEQIKKSLDGQFSL